MQESPRFKLSAFERTIMRMAWEGPWYAIWETEWLLTDYRISDTEPSISNGNSRSLARTTLLGLIEAGYVTLCLFRFTQGTKHIAPDELPSIIAAETNWHPGHADSWHFRIAATDRGKDLYESLDDKNEHREAVPLSDEPGLPWSLQQIRSYVDCQTDLYTFLRPWPAIEQVYNAVPDDPKERLCYFWRQVGGYGRRVLRWGGGDEERYFRGYLTLWLDALQQDENEWNDTIEKNPRPLEAASNDWTL